MMDQNLARALANVAIFLEFSETEVLDDDAAVQAMEQLTGDLQALDEKTRHELADRFRDISTDYRGDVAEFVAGLPDVFGLTT